MAKRKEKSQAEKQAIQNEWNNRCTMQAIQKLLPANLTIKSHAPVVKEVRKKTAHYPEVYTTIWCRDEDKKSILVLYNGSKIKMITEQQVKDEYVIKTVK
jgi:hypothetical protein